MTTTEKYIEQALFFLNQACNNDEVINQNPDIGWAVAALLRARQVKQ